MTESMVGPLPSFSMNSAWPKLRPQERKASANWMILPAAKAALLCTVAWTTTWSYTYTAHLMFHVWCLLYQYTAKLITAHCSLMIRCRSYSRSQGQIHSRMTCFWRFFGLKAAPSFAELLPHLRKKGKRFSILIPVMSLTPSFSMFFLLKQSIMLWLAAKLLTVGRGDKHGQTWVILPIKMSSDWLVKAGQRHGPKLAFEHPQSYNVGKPEKLPKKILIPTGFSLLPGNSPILHPSPPAPRSPTWRFPATPPGPVSARSDPRDRRPPPPQARWSAQNWPVRSVSFLCLNPPLNGAFSYSSLRTSKASEESWSLCLGWGDSVESL